MFKRFSTFFACLLLVLMPLQGLAAANMRICNGMMPAQAALNSPTVAQPMPCHEQAQRSTASKPLGDQHSHHCKTSCAALCASLCAMTALPSHAVSFLLPPSTQIASVLRQSYTAITLASLQRPPIRLS